MKRMKMINNSHQYYNITRFQSLGNCVIIHDVTKLLFDNRYFVSGVLATASLFYCNKITLPQGEGG